MRLEGLENIKRAKELLVNELLITWCLLGIVGSSCATEVTPMCVFVFVCKRVCV